MQSLKSSRVFGFRLSGISLRMVEKIIKEEKIFSPTSLMKKIISEYVDLKYGQEEYKEVKMKFIEDLLGEI